MKTSRTETEEIEEFLQGTAKDPGESLAFNARMQLNEELREKVRWQKKTYALVASYGRSKLKAELEEVQRKLFNDPAHIPFSERIKRLFIPPYQ